MAFHVVWSILFWVLAPETTFWLVEILWQPIGSFYSLVFEANTRNKTEHTMRKGMENCARKWCLFLCTILFQVTWAFWKMCLTNLLPCSKKVVVSSASAHKKYHRTANTELAISFFLPFLGKDKSVEWHNTGYRKMPQKTNLYQSIILLYFALFLSSWTEPLIWAYTSHEPL